MWKLAAGRRDEAESRGDDTAADFEEQRARTSIVLSTVSGFSAVEQAASDAVGGGREGDSRRPSASSSSCRRPHPLSSPGGPSTGSIACPTLSLSNVAASRAPRAARGPASRSRRPTLSPTAKGRARWGVPPVGPPSCACNPALARRHPPLSPQGRCDSVGLSRPRPRPRSLLAFLLLLPSLPHHDPACPPSFALPPRSTPTSTCATAGRTRSSP